jgi:hypothetical protein
MVNKSKNLLDKLLKDKNGRIVVWQSPNIPLAGWFVFMVATKLLHAGALKNGAQFLSTAFVFTWAYLERKDGDSYVRRLLGLVIFLMTILAHFKG